MTKRSLALLILLTLPLIGIANHGIPRLDDGVQYALIERDGPLQKAHVVTIDLTHPELSVVVCPGGDDPDGPDGRWQTRLRTVRSVALRNRLLVALNGDYFGADHHERFMGYEIKFPENSPGAICGPCVSDGAVWGTPVARFNALSVDEAGRVRIGTFDNVPPGTRQLVTGGQLLIVDGIPTSAADGRHPRSVVGLDRSGTRLFLIAVDGRRPDWSAGMTLEELKDLLLDLGVYQALNLDGGGSTTLVARDGDTGTVHLLNRPSDGSDLTIPLTIERPVGNVIGIRRSTPD